MRVLKDLLLWAILLIAPVSGWQGHRSYPFWLLVAGLAGLGAAVALSRHYPLASLFIVVGLTAIDGNYSFALPVISYLVGRRMASIRPATVAFAVIVLVATPYVLLRTDFLTWASQAGVLLYAGLFPWLVGRYRRQQLELVAAGWEHAEHLEREQRMVADQARLRERTRIAEDMHDSLGHELSLIALRAGALEVAPDLPEQHRTAAAELRASAGTATERLREVIGVLRDSPPSTRPTTESVTELVRRARDSGMAVTFDGDSGSLPPMVDRAAHRVVQEGLTNANKHAPGAAVTVSLHRDDAHLTVTVRNTPPPAGPLPGTVRGGQGLAGLGIAGLAERVRLTGGTLAAGPAEDGGFAVVARLPTSATAPPAPAPAETGSADRRRLAQRRARLGLVAAIAVPASIGAVLGATAIGYYLYATAGSVLTPSEYASLTNGQDQASVERVLPRREMFDPPTEADPPGSSCRYYRSDAELFPDRLDVYRLCFGDGRLLRKEIVQLP